MEEKLYYMFNKPQGCITARSDLVHKTVMEYFPQELAKKLFPVGRLDKDTEGLLFFTNDGKFDQHLMHPDFHATKTYLFYALGELNDEAVNEIESGMEIEGEVKKTKPAKLEIKERIRYQELLEKYEFAPEKRFRDNEYNRNRPVTIGVLIISEGRKHQVKRMLLAKGCRVIYLKRLAIGQVKLDESLQKGQYRTLTEEEIALLMADKK